MQVSYEGDKINFEGIELEEGYESSTGKSLVRFVSGKVALKDGSVASILVYKPLQKKKRQ